MAKAEKKHKLDIQKVLKALDRGDRSFYENLEIDEKKQVPFPVIRRWMSTVGKPDWGEYKRQGRKKGDGKGPIPTGDDPTTGDYLYLTNELANTGFMGLYKHPQLQWLLLSTIGAMLGGQTKDHQWLPIKSKTKSKLGEFIAKDHPMASAAELDMLEKLYTEEEFRWLLEDQGYQDKDIKKHMKEFKEEKKNG